MNLNKPNFKVSSRADDLIKELKKFPNAITVWVRTGKYKDKFPLLRTSITYQTNSTSDAKDYLKRFVSVLLVPKTHTKLSVLKGITGNQIFQLLSYTKKDKLIRIQTHDFDCFKTKKTFLSWKARGKVIYTLINRNGKLIGIIWFNKKRPQGYKEKPEIRIYSHVMEKKISKKFIEIVKSNFQKLTKGNVNQ